MRATRAVDTPTGRLRVASAYNRMMLQERFTTDDPIVLASPVAGTGIPLPVLEALTLRLVTEIPEPEWPEWIGAFVRREPFRLKVGERTVQDDEARVQVLTAQVAPFRAKRLPRLIELGIVEQA